MQDLERVAITEVTPSIVSRIVGGSHVAQEDPNGSFAVPTGDKIIQNVK